MMQSVFEQATNWYWAYVGNGFQLNLLALVAIGLLLFDKNKKENRWFLKYIIIFYLIMFCPITSYIIMNYCIGADVYWRMLWILPTTIVLAYCGTVFVSEYATKWKKVVCFLLLAFMIVHSGGNITDAMIPASDYDMSKLNPNVLKTAQIIGANAQERNEEPYAIVPNEMVCYIRQIDGNIHIPYGRDVIRQYQYHELFSVLCAEQLDMGVVSEYMNTHGYQYLVWPTVNHQEIHREIESFGYEKIGETDGYAIYYYSMNEGVRSQNQE